MAQCTCKCGTPSGKPPTFTISVPPSWADVDDAIQKAKDWAESPDSPDGAVDAESPTGKTMSARSWALEARKGAGSYTVATDQDIDNEVLND